MSAQEQASTPFARGETIQKFLEVEQAAPLLNRAANFITHQVDQPNHFVEKVAHWPSLLTDTPPAPSDEAKAKVEVHTDTRRLFRLDSVRTFATEEYRTVLSALLERIVVEALLGEYHQSLSLFSGLLLLSFEQDQVLNIVHHLNSHPKYIPGYWRNEAVAFATDAYVCQHLITEHLPEVGGLLVEHGILPETYMQKWFVGLCINVLPFKFLYQYIEAFLTHGHIFLMRFGLSFMANMKETLLACGADQSRMLAWLRLDPDICTIDEALIQKILDEATAEHYPLENLDMKALRDSCFEKHLRKRMEQAAEFKRKQQEEKEKEGEDDEEEEFGCQGAAPGDDECDNEPTIFIWNPNDALIVCKSCQKLERFRGYRPVVPPDLYQFCQRPDAAKKLKDARAIRDLSSGVAALST